MPGTLFDRTAYCAFALATKTLDYFGKADKNGTLFQQKRKYLLRIIPTAKALSEIAAVAHVLYHPMKRDEDVQSIKNHLRSLLAEGRRRKLQEHETFKWAERLLADGYAPSLKDGSEMPWAPKIDRMKTYRSFAKERTTVRDVLPRKFDRAIIHDLIEIAVEAPSSCNKQGLRFIIYDDPALIEKIAAIKRQAFLKKFPYILACCFDKEAYMGTDIAMTPYLDAGGALVNLANAATALGLGACWCNFSIKNAGAYRHHLFRQAVDLPKNLIPVSFVALGIPGKVLPKPPREPARFYLPYEKT
ncbi:nitroreductase family protein [Candidatus Woesearchaeota archaeon]|nr:nitroreductase family protein [Candidatus Woesearchaeota archaeon]